MRFKLLPKLKKPWRLCSGPLAASLLCVAAFTGSANAAIKPTGYFTKNIFDATVTGRVLDDKNQPLPGVNVSIVGTTVGTVTDANGRYKLTIPDAYANRSLSFSFIGFVSQSVAIAGQTEINISLKATNTSLDEVVVVGYGTQKRINVTGAVGTISSKNIESKPVLNTYQALQGESPNLIIQQTNLNPGSNVTVNIRGVGTLGDNTPLVVIDGIVGGNLNTINPNDIASVSVLKDAGSAAIYGSRAANGVILVTTKGGKFNSKPTVSYNGSYGLQDAKVLVHKVDAWDNAYYKNQSLINSGLPPAYTPDQIQALKDAGNGNWDVEHLLKKAPQQSHNVSISGGGETNSYYISAGYQDQGSNLIGNGGSGADFGYQKYNLRLNQTSVIGRFRTNIILNYTKTRNKTNSVGDNNIFADANRVPHNYNWTDADGNYLTNPVASQYNEYGVLEKGGFNQADNDEIFGAFNGQLSITKDLKLTGEFGGTIQNNGNFFRRTQVNYLPAGVYGNDLTVFDNNAKSLLTNTKVYAEYGKTISQHNFKVQLGVSSETYSQNGFQLQKTLTDPLLGTPTTGTIVDTQNSFNSIAVNAYSLLSAFGRLNYSYADKYLFEALFRQDASSKFAAGNRSSFFPSVSAGWIVTRESFMESVKNTLSTFKLRASYGTVGNQNVGNYQYQTTYFNYPNAYGFGNNIVGGAGTNIANRDITWEKATKLNVGFDAGFFDDKLTASFDYFRETRSNILAPRADVPLIFGAGSPDYNVAKVRNKGWEASVTYNLRGKDLTQSFSINVADNKNTLLKLTGSATETIINQDVFQLIRRVGQPITQYYGYETDGFFQNQQDITNSPKIAGNSVQPGDLKFKDRNGDGIIDEKDKTVLGNPFPRYTFGFTYRVAYKGFDMSFFIQGVGKRDQFLRGELVEPFHYGYGATVYEHQTDIWSPTNPNARYPILANIGSPSNTNNWRTGSDLYKYNAAYARLKNVNIGYSFGKAVTQKLGVQRLRVSLIGQNLATLTKLKFIDPETSEFGNNLGLGSASNSARQYPLPVFYGAGLDVTF
ncbi:SusC/RagA family TonB-linked outer membrane protein [Mucilaginibacter pedocola]|uniref:SusC/RagA family TonB-linked outer membrane protein n=1 Tax=Mucilaginibacter pedocola TaxID=1792845 RepID=A0A1S9P9Y2_9SPHI|nr:TonB-dependent receptor [Mucilaginibacter pedocola]OOQ57751.1 SusC/RagA family TonB-linked outer membrane protein [Mucilaginibacter pedocola]